MLTGVYNTIFFKKSLIKSFSKLFLARSPVSALSSGLESELDRSAAFEQRLADQLQQGRGRANTALKRNVSWLL